MGYLKKIVPPLELCKKIPNGKFNESGLFWRPFDDRAGGGVLIRIDAKFNVKRNNALIPAPTLEEIMNDLPDDVNVRMKLGKNGRRYFQVSWYSEAKWTTNPAAQALKLWLNMEAVNEYNETNGKGYEKPWPQVGDVYFCISSIGAIRDVNYDDFPIDNCLREFGNFFRTREEAEAALERVKKALKGE